MSTLVWFRQDLRIADHPALTHACRAGGEILCVYIEDTDAPADVQRGAASRVWLHHALLDLSAQLRTLGLELSCFRGPAAQIITDICAAHHVTHVHWNRVYEPHNVARDKRLKAVLRDQGLNVTSHRGNLLMEPMEVVSKSGTPFRVFTPFYKASLAQGFETDVCDTPTGSYQGVAVQGALAVDALDLLPRAPRWDIAMTTYWDISEAGAHKKLHNFLRMTGESYSTERDRPDLPSTSRLSPYLAFGQITPRQIWRAAKDTGTPHEHFLREVFWREFSYHLLFHNPALRDTPLQPSFADFPWQEDANILTRWQQGQTGYPIVDAGMRELYTTGWMHNRVRMIVASLLVKHCLQPWQAGESWFWDTLVDADLASNSASWQWVAGCGADAAPYFRIFNPIIQGQKFDPTGVYVRKWCPELARVPDKLIHTPWDYQGTLDYPAPVVDHESGRARALRAYEMLKGRDTISA